MRSLKIESISINHKMIHILRIHTLKVNKRATAQDLNRPFFRKLSKNMTMIAWEHNRKILNRKKVVKSIGMKLLYHNIQQWWWWCSTIDMESAKNEQGMSKCWDKTTIPWKAFFHSKFKNRKKFESGEKFSPRDNQNIQHSFSQKNFCVSNQKPREVVMENSNECLVVHTHTHA